MSLPSTMKAVTGVAGSAAALLATATTPEQVTACALAGLSDLATWLVPNDLDHPRWWRRAGKAVVSAAGVGLAAVPLALADYEGAGPSVNLAGVWLQLDAADWTTLGALAARTALVALLANGPDERTTTATGDGDDEHEVIDLDPAALSDDPIPAAPSGQTLTGLMAAVPAAPARVPAEQAAALAARPDRYARRAARQLERAGRHEAGQ